MSSKAISNGLQTHDALEVARDQRRRENRVVELERHGPVHRGERAGADRLARPRRAAAPRVARQPEQHRRHARGIDVVGLDVAVDADRACQD